MGLFIGESVRISPATASNIGRDDSLEPRNGSLETSTNSFLGSHGSLEHRNGSFPPSNSSLVPFNSSLERRNSSLASFPAPPSQAPLLSFPYAHELSNADQPLPPARAAKPPPGARGVS